VSGLTIIQVAVKKWFNCRLRVRNDLLCVECDVKP